MRGAARDTPERGGLGRRLPARLAQLFERVGLQLCHRTELADEFPPLLSAAQLELRAIAVPQTTADVQYGAVLMVPHDPIGIACGRQSVRAADVVERIVRLHLPRVVDQVN